MRWCDESITLYNAIFDAEADRDRYIRTVINGVHWFCEVVTTVDASGLRAADRYIVRIPVEADASGKQYADPISYAVDQEDRFTLRPGDIIVRGIAAEEDPRPTDLQRAYDDCITILSITDSTHAPNAPHWKVVGK